ncbi:hypothetical protein BDB01DRAFT_852667 [Pilobolus umbonatus]|nr:hypothetical protein BDB01DRAFT_856620 [Pilobolus umbonatus]KAI8978134.1 hypothetical protein BDB01DRAFT_852667 [Pilobolus umbonatus]
MVFGFVQLVFGIHTIESMHEPYLATGPRNFWCRRWNMFVAYFLHSQIFTKSTLEHKKDDDKDMKAYVEEDSGTAEKKSLISF